MNAEFYYNFFVIKCFIFSEFHILKNDWPEPRSKISLCFLRPVNRRIVFIALLCLLSYMMVLRGKTLIDHVFSRVAERKGI